MSRRAWPPGRGYTAEFMQAAQRRRRPLRALSGRGGRRARRRGFARTRRRGALSRGRRAGRAYPLPLPAHESAHARLGRHGQRARADRGRTARPGRRLRRARRRHFLSSAFQRAGADAARLAVRQSLHDAGRGLRAADRRPRAGRQRRCAGWFRSCALHRRHARAQSFGTVPAIGGGCYGAGKIRAEERARERDP